jgi:hypothetical protein
MVPLGWRMVDPIEGTRSGPEPVAARPVVGPVRTPRRRFCAAGAAADERHASARRAVAASESRGVATLGPRVRSGTRIEPAGRPRASAPPFRRRGARRDQRGMVGGQGLCHDG